MELVPGDLVRVSPGTKMQTVDLRSNWVALEALRNVPEFEAVAGFAHLSPTAVAAPSPVVVEATVIDVRPDVLTLRTGPRDEPLRWRVQRVGPWIQRTLLHASKGDNCYHSLAPPESLPIASCHATFDMPAVLDAEQQFEFVRESRNAFLVKHPSNAPHFVQGRSLLVPAEKCNAAMKSP